MRQFYYAVIAGIALAATLPGPLVAAGQYDVPRQSYATGDEPFRLAQACQSAPPSCGLRTAGCMQYRGSCCIRWICT